MTKKQSEDTSQTSGRIILWHRPFGDIADDGFIQIHSK